MEFYIGQPDLWLEEALPDLSASKNLMEDLLLMAKSRAYFEA
jgi:hypothetical protein